MAVAVIETLTEVDRVVEATTAAFAAQREPTAEMALAEFIAVPIAAGVLRSVVVPGTRTVEVPVDEGVDPAVLGPVAWDLQERGWQLTVLAPLVRLGETHAALRGTPCTLQGWWQDGAGLEFGGREIP